MVTMGIKRTDSWKRATNWFKRPKDRDVEAQSKPLDALSKPREPLKPIVNNATKGTNGYKENSWPGYFLTFETLDTFLKKTFDNYDTNLMVRRNTCWIFSQLTSP
jgi:hypothetical protein